MFALIVLEIPDLSSPDKEKNWQQIEYNVSMIPDKENGIRKLGKNVVELDLENNLSYFCSLVTVADNNCISYQVLFLEEKPHWINPPLKNPDMVAAFGD